MIKKFQSPAGPIEYQQAHSGAFSVNDPNTAGYAEGSERRAAMRRELYDLTHSAPYQLTNAGLWMAAPYTYGIAAIPASVMSSAAIASDANDIVNNGIDIGNWINTVFDVATNAERAANAAQGAFISATVAHDASLNAYNLASRALRKVLKTTAKAKAKKDALSRVAFVGNQAATSAYKKAAQEATQAAKNANFVPSSKPLNIFAQSPRTGEIGVLGKYTTIEQAAKNNMIRGRLADNFIKKDIAEDAARKALIKAGQKYGQAVSAYSEALRWRPLGIASAAFEGERQVFNNISDNIGK